MLNYYIYIKIADLFCLAAVYRYRGGALYAKHRSLIVTCIRLLRAVLVISVLGRPSQEEITFPLFTETKFYWSRQVVWRLLLRATLPLLQSFGYRTPLYLHIPAILAPSFCLSLLIPRRCAIECTTNPVFYTRLYSLTTSFFSSWKPKLLPMSLTDTSVIDLMTCKQKCFLTNEFILLFVGCICPTMILAAIEEPFKMDVLAQQFGGRPIYASSKALLTHSFLLFPFIAAITFEIMMIVVTNFM